MQPQTTPVGDVDAVYAETRVARILYQRGLYPPEDFEMVKKYNLNMLRSNDPALSKYLHSIMSQLSCVWPRNLRYFPTDCGELDLCSAWLMAGKVSRLVMAISSKETREVVERWQFDVSIETPTVESEESKENQPLG